MKNLIKSQDTIIFKGIQRGAKLFPLRGVPIPQGLDNLPKSIVLEKFTAPFYITLIRDPEFPNLFKYLLDEYSEKQRQWYRQLGAAHISGPYQLSINETDGMQGTLVGHEGRLFLYRSRAGETPIVMHAEDVKVTKIERRNRDLEAGTFS